MMTYWQLLENIPGSKLRLTKFDDDILSHFKKEFPEFDPAATINKDEMKSKDGKERWRKFIAEYEKKVEDFNFGTMLRLNPKFEYGEKETIFGMTATCTDEVSYLTFPLAVRMQFYAIEIARYIVMGIVKVDRANLARNRAGLNDWIYEKAHASSEKKS
jgi:hypothetical protein